MKKRSHLNVNELTDPEQDSHSTAYNEPKFKGDVIYATFMGQSKETFYKQDEDIRDCTRDSKLNIV